MSKKRTELIDQNSGLSLRKKRTEEEKRKPKNKKVENNITINGLSVKHALFVDAYIQCLGSGARAYMQVYPGAKYSTASTNASLLLSKECIKLAIRERYSQLFAEKTETFRQSETYKSIEAIGDSDIFDVIDIVGDEARIKNPDEMSPATRKAVKSIVVSRKESETGSSVTHTVVMYDKVKCLELRAKLQNMLNEEPAQIDVVVIPARMPTAAEKERRQKEIEDNRNITDAEEVE